MNVTQKGHISMKIILLKIKNQENDIARNNNNKFNNFKKEKVRLNHCNQTFVVQTS